ncbi:MAG: hypothetical protein ABIJ16_14395, partial [Bacteroidota bacterium]
MKKNARIILIMISCMFFGYLLHAQDFSPAVLWTFKEKIKLSPEQIEKLYNEQPEEVKEKIQHYLKSVRVAGETNITNSTEI